MPIIDDSDTTPVSTIHVDPIEYRHNVGDHYVKRSSHSDKNSGSSILKLSPLRDVIGNVTIRLRLGTFL